MIAYSPHNKNVRVKSKGVVGQKVVNVRDFPVKILMHPRPLILAMSDF